MSLTLTTTFCRQLKMIAKAVVLFLSTPQNTVNLLKKMAVPEQPNAADILYL